MRIGLLFVACAIAGCANPLNQHTAENYYREGERALQAGNLPLAKRDFSRALINAQLGHMGPAAEAQAAKKLAQVLGNMCEYDEAEQSFLQAITAEELAFPAVPLRTFPTRVELAQFNFDIERYDRAVLYYEKALPIGAPVLERKDPLRLALLFDDYSVALSKVGKSGEAADAKANASSLRANAQGQSAGVAKSAADYAPYPKSCTGG